MGAPHQQPVRVAVLGPVRAWRDSTPVDVGGPRQRSLLARLALAKGQVVSVDRLIEDLWHGEPPPKALSALQAYVSHLRRVLEPDRVRRAPAEIIVSAAPGYRLAL
ncbi:MAG: winged helix-turn-helix domain-containing protein, partial [Mycolicibacterium aromaticivorans]|nr:winged helix-turn-helix domain-containing protein [Mycolicibacterium aromaticivorans]